MSVNPKHLAAGLEEVPLDTPQVEQQTEAPRLRLIGLDDFTVRPTVNWLYRDLLPAESILLVFGAPKSGKTHVVVDMTMHAAHGMHWHGHSVARPLRIAYLAGEGHNGLRVRLHAWRRAHSAELSGDMRILPEALSLAGRLDELIEMLSAFKPDVIVADTLNAYFGGLDENSTQDMTAFVAAVRALRDTLRCSIVIIHHTGLADATRERGSSVLRGAADVIAQVARDEAGTGLIGFQVIEARDMEPWEAPVALKLAPSATDWADEEGQPVTTCLVEAADQPVTLPGRGGRPLGEAQGTMVEIMRQFARERSTGAPEVTLARHEIAAAAKSRGLSRQSISSAWRPLQQRGMVKLVEPGSVIVKVPR